MDILLLHGLGATGAVWDGLTELLDDDWLAPDLPGHGGSSRLHRYSFGGMAAAIVDQLPAKGPFVVVGHSLGGVLALTLASGWFGIDVAGVLAVGVKVEWSADDLARAAAMATRPARVFGTREEAEQAYRKMSGLDRVDPAGITEGDDGWRLTLDLAAFGVGAPDMAGLLRTARCPVVLAAGEHDHMSRPEQLRTLSTDAALDDAAPQGVPSQGEPLKIKSSRSWGPGATELGPGCVQLTGLGHNAHVEDPAALLPLLYSLR